MNLVEFEKLMEQKWDEIKKAAEASKFSQGALLDWAKIYRILDSEQRLLADQVVSDWVLSKDLGKQFVALALVDHFMIRMALPQLREFETDCQRRVGQRTDKRADPAALYLSTKVTQIINRICAPDDLCKNSNDEKLKPDIAF